MSDAANSLTCGCVPGLRTCSFHIPVQFNESADDAPAPAGAVARVEGRCDDCQQPYATWFADNNVWNLVMGGPDAKGDPGGMLCPRCFTVRAESVYALPIWRLHLDRVNRVKQPAPAGAAADDEAVEALATVMHDTYERGRDLAGWRAIARAVLASDWLRERTAQRYADGWNEARSELLTQMDEWKERVEQQAREREAGAWDAGWDAHRRCADAVATWNASEGTEAPDDLHIKNPYADRGGDRG